ncbi:hypothetical protein EV193_106199 [Herbihabitans rhizosphaerae]|uniref:DUF1508 domain-containing protein n=1 Tax=Herbihabitans rhizosphaerae TaxID=1872711 RepID=A0A4Q7KL62_9PSEU|nr:hypothetical protein [Herbihabitans rhizosphaerae]RZS36964.1 hypothetical protein EV193_106199 [Herbihabitans rhizosphaerae]
METLSIEGGSWRWQLSVAGAPVATSQHAYGRRTEARLGADRFRTSVATAEVMKDIVVFPSRDLVSPSARLLELLRPEVRAQKS